MDKNEKRFYSLVSENDNSLKQLFDRFYVIPKDFSFIGNEDKIILEKYHLSLLNQLVSEGGNGYIVFRGKKPKKLSEIEIALIKSDNVSTQRELAFKYNVSNATINKIKNNKY